MSGATQRSKLDGGAGDERGDRKSRGAFFTPLPIASFLASWAINEPNDVVLDPSCGEAVFLLAAGRRLRELGCGDHDLDRQVVGIDVHSASLDEATVLLGDEGLGAHLIHSDFFDVASPQQLTGSIPLVDAVIGNPPFIRYQEHMGDARKRSAQAALAQGVRLSGLASSWAALLVHASSFLKPEGRLAMVLPAELLTVHYAEPIRRWLRGRFAKVNLVMFERLQFADAIEKVVLLVAQGSGGCDSFSLYNVDDADDLSALRPFDHLNATPANEGKWTDLFLTGRQRQLFKKVTDEYFVGLGDYGSPELGTVTGSNAFFALSESTRLKFGLAEGQVARISPPGTRHLKGLSFTTSEWENLRTADEPVWLLYPDIDDDSPELRTYLASGKKLGVPAAYKCQVRTPWWRPPMVSAPDLFFTYMSYRYPKLISNSAQVSFVNSMHGVRLKPGIGQVPKAALPLVAFNSVTMLGAEIHGRSYGGGILKMEPREAAVLPVPKAGELKQAWELLKTEKSTLDRQLRNGLWTNVVKRVDDALLTKVMGLPWAELAELQAAAHALRERRIGNVTREHGDGG